MTIPIETPDAPELASTSSYADAEDPDVADARRRELADALQDGAWEDAFSEWAEHTDLDDEELRVAADLEMFGAFDFFWDDVVDRVGFDAPSIPEDWRERSLHPGLDTWGTVSSINIEMTELGRTVRDVVETSYLDWEPEADEGDPDVAVTDGDGE